MKHLARSISCPLILSILRWLVYCTVFSTCVVSDDTPKRTRLSSLISARNIFLPCIVLHKLIYNAGYCISLDCLCQKECGICIHQSIFCDRRIPFNFKHSIDKKILMLCSLNSTQSIKCNILKRSTT